jgi:hypothetical protein
MTARHPITYREPARSWTPGRLADPLNANRQGAAVITANPTLTTATRPTVTCSPPLNLGDCVYRDTMIAMAMTSTVTTLAASVPPKVSTKSSCRPG